MKYLALIGIVVLSGCSIDNSDLVENSYTATQTDTKTGLVLETSEKMWVSFPEMVAIYNGVQACLGMTAPGPTVYFKSFKEYFNGAIGAPWGFHTKGTIYINTDENIPVGIERNKYTDTETLRHEYIHNVLYYNTGRGDPRHTSEMFAQCGPGANTYN